MKLIHRHIFANVALTCAAAVGLFAFVLLLGNALKDLLGYVLSGQLEAWTFLRLIALLVPYVVAYALPMGVLAGVLLVLGRMSSDHELTAIRASGVSVAGISAPILFLALMGVALGVAINFEYMPRARMAYQRELADAVRRNPLNFIVPKTFIRDFPGKVVYVGEKDGLKLGDIWVWELDKQNRVIRFHRARAGSVSFDETRNVLTFVGQFTATEARDRDDPERYDGFARAAVADRTQPIELSLENMTGGRTVRTKLKWMTFEQLMAEWRRLGRPAAGKSYAEQSAERMKVQVTIHEKFATAFCVLSFALIAIPLGIKVSRRETSANLGVALVLVMGYYFATIVVHWFDNKPALRPDLLMWLPNLGFQALGIWMFRRVDRQ